MTKHWILLGAVILIIASCGDSKNIQETEKSLLGDTTVKEISKEVLIEKVKEINAVSLKEGNLLEKPESWSKSNPSVRNGTFYFGSKASIIETNEEGKRRYLKLRLNDGTVGWASDWLIVEEAERAVVATKSIRLYKKADIAAFSDQKIVFGQKIALGNKVIGGFQQIVFKGDDKKPHKFWVKEKDVRNISIDDNDYVLSEYLEKLKNITVEEDKIELVDDIRDNDDFLKSPFYAKIISLIDEDDKLAEEIEIDENSNEEMILDSIDLGDDF